MRIIIGALAALAVSAGAAHAQSTGFTADIVPVQDSCHLQVTSPSLDGNDVEIDLIYRPGSITVILTSSEWTSLSDEGEYKLDFNFEPSGRSFSLVGGASGPDQRGRYGFAFINVPDDFMRQFASANRLQPTWRGQVVADFSLIGSARSVADLRTCGDEVARQMRRRDPFAD